MKAALLAASLLQICTFAVSPALGYLREAFPDADERWISMIMSAPSFTQMLAFVLHGTVLRRKNPKQMLLMGSLLALLGGTSPVFCRDIWAVVACRAVLGLGTGTTILLTMRLIVSMFDGEEKAKLLGAQAFVVNLGGIAFSFFGGLLANISWRACFFLYLICAAVFGLTACFVPGTLQEKKDEEPVNSFRTEKNRTIFILAFSLLFSTAVFMHNGYIALLLTDNGLRDSTFIGLVSTAFMTGGLIAGPALVFAIRFLKMRLPSVCMLAAGVCLFLIGFVPTSWFVLVLSVLLGLCFSLSMPAMISFLTAGLSGDRLIIACALFQGLNSIGQFFSERLFAQFRRFQCLDSMNGEFHTAGMFLIFGAVVTALLVSKYPELLKGKEG